MNKLIRAALSALLFAVGLILPTFAVAETQPLTPDGNLEIVEADDRKILRNAIARLLYGFHHADGQQI